MHPVERRCCSSLATKIPRQAAWVLQGSARNWKMARWMLRKWRRVRLISAEMTIYASLDLPPKVANKMIPLIMKMRWLNLNKIMVNIIRSPPKIFTLTTGNISICKLLLNRLVKNCISWRRCLEGEEEDQILGEAPCKTVVTLKLQGSSNFSRETAMTKVLFSRLMKSSNNNRLYQIRISPKESRFTGV